MRGRGIIIGLVGWMLSVGGMVLAQITPPLLIVQEGVLYRVDERGLQVYSECRPPEAGAQVYGAPAVANTSPIPLLAYRAIGASAVQSLALLESLGVSLVPTELWLCREGQPEALALQPSETIFSPQMVQGVFSMRSAPVFAPDASGVAWTEISSQQSRQLVIYDIASASRRTIALDALASLPESVLPAPPELWWTTAGILVALPQQNTDSPTLLTIGALYAPTGEFLSLQLLTSESEGADFVLERLVLETGERSLYAAYFLEAGWQAVDVLTGERASLNDIPELYMRSAPEQGGWLYEAQGMLGAMWYSRDFTDAQGSPTVFIGYNAAQLALSPDGRRLALVLDEVSVWQDGFQMSIEGTQGWTGADVAWGAQAWRLPESALSWQTPQG